MLGRGMEKIGLLAGAALALATLGCSSEDSSAGPTGGSGGSGGAAGSAGAAGAGGGGGSTACSAPPRSFWTWDLGVMPPLDVQVSATCRAQTEHAYVYVADDVWDTALSQPQVDVIVQAFAHATPAEPSRGIYELTVETFGEPPDIDQDGRVVLFYQHMAGFQGYTFDGFFRSLDQTPGAMSNQTEMLHLNATGPNAPDSDYMLGVAAHELVHLIGSRYDSGEEGWLDEALAEAAMTRAGYLTDLPAAKGYVKSTATTPLCVTSYSDYGATFSFGTYLLDRFGPPFLAKVLQDPKKGRASVEAHLPVGSTFNSLFGEFMVACALDQPSIGDGRFGFSSVELSGLGFETSALIDAAAHWAEVVAFGSRNLKFSPPGAGTLSVLLESPDLAKLVAHSVVFDPTSPSGAKVTPHDLTNSPTIAVTTSAGQVVVLVIAADVGPALATSKDAPKLTFTYNATFAP